MSNKKRWDQLLEPQTFRERSGKAECDARNHFESDYSRIIVSSSFRRLQDKAQVFPLERGDFVRTRLTHSLEVSHLGNSIGKSIEKQLIDKGSLEEDKQGVISNILATAGLVHDLGNPPFGHYGEYAIQTYFKKYLKTNDILSNQQKSDLEKFDGNVQTFRILKKLQYLGDEHSYNLTYPTLATIIKYPKDSVEGNKGSKAKNISEKKFGYFYSESEEYKKIDELLGLNGSRHPLTFLLEAADDIAYCVADIEDGAQKKLIKIEDIKEKIEELIKDKKSIQDEAVKKRVKKLESLKEKIKEIEKEWNGKLEKNSLENKIIIQKLKIFIQGEMIKETVDFFVENEEKILNGELKDEILKESEFGLVKQVFSELAIKKIYPSKEIINAEILSFQVIEKLLDIFVNAAMDNLNNQEKSTGSKQSQKLMSLISENYIHIYQNYEPITEDKDKVYSILKLCVDFISGMTDNFALKLFKELSGIKS